MTVKAYIKRQTGWTDEQVEAYCDGFRYVWDFWFAHCRVDVALPDARDLYDYFRDDVRTGEISVIAA